jgi:hypothetical protein
VSALGRTILAAALASRLGLAGCGSGSETPSASVAPSPSPTAPAGTNAIYVSPQGLASNDGSAARPLDLATALSPSSPAQPGTTIWLRGGTYRGGFVSSLNGTATAPIVVRAAAGERPIIDAANPEAIQHGIALQALGSYTWFWGLEVTYSSPTRADTGGPGTPNGVYANQSTGLRFINMVVHDMPGQGFGVWAESTGAEVYGNIIFDNGTNHFDHGIYTQNVGQTKRIEDNIIFNQASHGLHAYGSSDAMLDHFYVAGNIAFSNGALLGGAERNILVGGGRVAQDLTVIDNATYYPPASDKGSNNLGYLAGCAGATVTGNAFVGPNALTLVNCLPSPLTGNTFVGGVEPPDLNMVDPANSYTFGMPAGARVIVRPNRYEPGRAHVVIYNWDLQPQVGVDLSASGLRSGQAYEIRDAQDYFGTPVATGSYTGAPVTLPMTGLRTAMPVWNDAVTPRHTAPEFAAFVVLPR